MSKKGQANTFWIIIGAVIALVVLVVLLLIFTGKSNQLEIGLLECESKGAECVDKGTCRADGGTLSSSFECPDAETQECCFTKKERESS